MHPTTVLVFTWLISAVFLSISQCSTSTKAFSFCSIYKSTFTLLCEHVIINSSLLNVIHQTPNQCLNYPQFKFANSILFSMLMFRSVCVFRSRLVWVSGRVPGSPTGRAAPRSWRSPGVGTYVYMC